LYWQNAPTDELALPESEEPDVGCFTRGHNGWTQGMCLVDRFVKNTAEILSPLKPMLEAAYGWDSSDFGAVVSAYGWFNVFFAMLIIVGILLIKWVCASARSHQQQPWSPAPA